MCLRSTNSLRILMRMARMQLYLPDDLYELVKASGIAASELFQQAVRAELKRRHLLAEADAYLKKLGREVGAPSRLLKKSRGLTKGIDNRASV